MEYVGLTDIGLVRDKNQDSYLICQNEYGDLLALVADGIGGGPAGEVASSELLAYFEKEFKKSGPFSDADSVDNYLKYHFKQANSYIYNLSINNEKYRGMGTTMSGLFVNDKYISCLNCGDSRVYGFYDGNIYALSKDDTLVNEMIANGKITYEESLSHPLRHYLTKAVGIYNTMNCDVHNVKKMDYYLISSDGLHSYVSDADLLKTINDKALSLIERLNKLRDLALAAGGYDNITIILIKV